MHSASVRLPGKGGFHFLLHGGDFRGAIVGGPCLAQPPAPAINRESLLPAGAHLLQYLRLPVGRQGGVHPHGFDGDSLFVRTQRMHPRFQRVQKITLRGPFDSEAANHGGAQAGIG